MPKLERRRAVLDSWYRMESLAHSLKATSQLDAPTRLKLTVSAALSQVAMPGIWSQGPVYRRLDSGFLAQPLIPKAPPTPRLHIDQVNGSLRVFDPVHSPDFSEIPATMSLPELQPSKAPPISSKPRVPFLLTAVAAGFAAGLAAAFLFGWL
jgi:hypothetical protein